MFLLNSYGFKKQIKRNILHLLKYKVIYTGFFKNLYNYNYKNSVLAVT